MRAQRAQSIAPLAAATHVRWLVHRGWAERVALRDEAGQTAPAPDALEEGDTLRLGAKGHLAPRYSLEREFHEVATDAASLVCGIDEDLGDRREEIAIGENANGPDEAVAVPRADVRGARQCRRRVARGIVTWPDSFRECEEIGGRNPSL